MTNQSPMNRDGAVERLRELVARQVPFLHQGRSFDGIDCIGSLCYGFDYRGPVPNYPEDPINGELEGELTKLLGEPLLSYSAVNRLTDWGPLQSLDILSMQYRGPIRHVAVVVPYIDQRQVPGGLSVVHTDAMLGRVTEHILDAKWLRRVVKVWRP